MDANEISPPEVDAVIERGDARSLAQFADELPRRRGGKKTHISCLYRWTTTGCRGVKLRYVQIGATRCTTRRWLAEFFAALSTAESPVACATHTPAARRRQLEKVNRELDRKGVC